jgi:ferrous iron transport protein A
MNLRDAEIEKEYTIKQVNSNDDELNAFLFSLGCYSGETIAVISRAKKTCIVSIKDGRYTIDKELAESIII